jgi:release factor glutamine methyltransferase
MLPTPIIKGDFQNVYEPAEDTYLLLDVLEEDLDREVFKVVVEVGSGSGCVSTFIAKNFNAHVVSVLLFKFRLI